jgi:hypothetical protein
MTELELNPRQAALILEVSEEGEIKLEVAVNQSGDRNGEFAASICRVIAAKLVSDEHFQEEILSVLYADEEEDIGDNH